jgi:ATP-dependent RNA helicase DDX3X
MQCKAAHWLWQLQQSLMLVFVETKRGSDALEDWLFCMGFPAATIHGD